MATQRYHVQIPGICKETGCCRCNQIKDLELGRLFWILRVVPTCNYTYLYKEEAEGDLTQNRTHTCVRTHIHRGEHNVKTKAEVGHKPRNTSSYYKLEEARNGHSPRASGESMALSTHSFQPSDSDFGLLGSRTVKE